MLNWLIVRCPEFTFNKTRLSILKNWAGFSFLIIGILLSGFGCQTSSKAYDPEVWDGYYAGYFSKGPVDQGEPTFYVRMFKLENGTPKVALTYPEKGIPGIWSTGLSSASGTIRIEFYSLFTALRGSFESNNQVFKGEWKQQGQVAPIYLSRLPDETSRTEWSNALAGAQNRSKVMAPTIPGERESRNTAAQKSQDSDTDPVSNANANNSSNNAQGTKGPINPRRPQTPTPPFPYKTEEVMVDQARDKIQLAGVLSVPPGAGPFPAVLLINGSGAHDRNGTMFGHEPFAVLADYFARNGLASLRMDDRQVGKSTGVFLDATTRDFSYDMEACFNFLKNRPEIDQNRVGLLGHSEGGLVAPLVAIRNNDVAFMVLLGAPGLPGSEILPMQNALIYRATGASEEMIQLNKTLYQTIHDMLNNQNLSAEEAGEKILEFHRLTWQALGDPSEERFKESEDALKKRLPMLTSPWFKFFLNYDPRPTLKRVVCPTLVLGAEKDLQAPPRQNLAPIESALKLGGNLNYTVRALPGLNHLFQEAPTGAPSEYERIPQTFSPFAMALILKWIGDEALAY